MSKVNYKKTLLRVSELKSQGIDALHQRVTLLVDVFEDAAFRADIGGDDFTLAGMLDRYVDDCALTFLELRTVLQAFPNSCDWKGSSLRDVLAKALERSTDGMAEKPERAPRRTVTIKEFEKVEEKLKDAEFARKTMAEELAELRSENRSLLAENARLEGRIVELERMIERFSPREVSRH